MNVSAPYQDPRSRSHRRPWLVAIKQDDAVRVMPFVTRDEAERWRAGLAGALANELADCARLIWSDDA